MSDLNTENTTYDSQQLAEDIAQGEEKSPQVNVEADYERSKQFDVAEIDRTGAGAKAAADAQTSTSETKAETGDPADYLQMAKEVTPKEDQI
jgi:hypothetical protein